MSPQGNVSYPYPGFGGGLNLRDKVDSIDPTQCIDALNVIFTDRGAVEQRPGYDNLTKSALTNRVASLEPFYTSAGTKQLLAGCGTRLEAINTSGEVVKSATGLTSAVWDFARFGKPNSEVAYAGNGTDTLRKWNGAEWTAPKATVDGVAEKAMPKAGTLCVWPSGGNRIVATRFSTTTGGPNGTTSSPDHVWFSDPGDPESWHTVAPEENDVQLMPGNGEPIQAAIAWRELVFVFKETSFFVFYGIGGAEGSPEFLFRPVESGVGLTSPRAVCADGTGVYFMGRNGIYRTTGQEPEMVSSLVEPIWSGEISAFYAGGILAHGSITNCAMASYRNRIYLSFPSESANNRTLSFDPLKGWWTISDIPASCLTSFRVGSEEELAFGYASGSNHVGRHSLAYTSDDGTAISSRWRSGWFDLGSPDAKTIRSNKFWGSGKVKEALGHDFLQDPGTLFELDFSDPSTPEWGGTEWGASTWAEPRGLVQKERLTATLGSTFSLYFSNTTLDQEWSVHRVTNHLREIAKPGTVNA